MPPPPGSDAEETPVEEEAEYPVEDEEQPFTEGLVLIARGVGTILDALYANPDLVLRILHLVVEMKTEPATSTDAPSI
jgi:hypothetical protein